MPPLSSTAASSGETYGRLVKITSPGLRVHHVLHGVAALEALGEGLDDLAVLADLLDGDALGGAAVVLPDDDFLGQSTRRRVR